MQPIILLKEGTDRAQGRGAQTANILAARAVADAVRSVLGPRGREKMLIDPMGEVVVTNDGATVLHHMEVQHPAARMLIALSQAQDQEVGDGTTSVVVLAGALLHHAEALLEDVHATRIVAGYRMAAARAVEELHSLAWEVDLAGEAGLEAAARAAMGTKLPVVDAGGALARMAVQAARAVAEERAVGGSAGGAGGVVVDVAHIQVVKRPGGGVGEAELAQGIILDRERLRRDMPPLVSEARIALLDASLEVPKLEAAAEIRIRGVGARERFLAREEAALQEMVEHVVKAGANVVLTSKAVDDRAQQMLARRGVFALRNVARRDLELLARATGGRIVADVTDLATEDLGSAARVEERRVAEQPLTFVTGCRNPASVAVLLRGGSVHVVDELERSFHDALRVVAGLLEDGGRVVPGGGAAEVEVAKRLRAWAPSVGGREQLAVEAFADALEELPRALAGNAGLDAIDVLVALRSAHGGGRTEAGLDVTTGEVEDMAARGILDPLRLKVGVVRGATDAATMLLRIDDVIASGQGGGGPSGRGAVGAAES